MTTRFQPEVLEYEKANGETEHRETRFADSSSLAAATTRDSEKGSSRYASSTTGLEHVEANKKLERKLVRKLGQFKSLDFLFSSLLTQVRVSRLRHLAHGSPAVSIRLP